MRSVTRHHVRGLAGRLSAVLTVLALLSGGAAVNHARVRADARTTVEAARVESPGQAGGTSTAPSGATLYRTYCAVCHGPDARGRGPLASSLRVAPTDLTQLARRSGGTYPRLAVTRSIDGRDTVRGHGSGDMPVWGDAFERSAAAGPDAVRARIEALVAYLAGVQEPR
jgi:mono/diheme cytochrome c family protein